MTPVASAAGALYQTFKIEWSRPAPARACRTVDAFHLADYRTDPRPAAAGGLDCGAVSGGAVAAAADAAVSKPARRPCDRARLRPRIPGRNRSRPAAGILARRYRLSCRRQSHVRRLSAGAALLDRHILVALSAGARRRRRPAGGARRTADHDGCRVQFARRRVWPAGAGASAVGAAAAAFLAADRPASPQRLVRLVDRGRPAAADHPGRDRPLAPDRRPSRSRPRADGAR